MVQILFTVFRMGHMYENAQIIQAHATQLYFPQFYCPIYKL